MKISVDGGALNQKNNKHFGTSVFSENMVSALKKFDKKNQYLIYTFDSLRPKKFWLKGRVSIEEFKQKKDVFLALNQALPLYASGKIISFCHGLSYYFYPQYYSTKDLVRLNNQLKEMVKRSDKIIVSSEKVKKELVLISRYVKAKIIVLPFGIPMDINNKLKVKSEKLKIRKYFLFVGNNQPIKNIQFIEKAFAEFRKSHNNYKLHLITKNTSRKELKKFYQEATALLTASYYESFNFPVLEALSQGCPVVGLKSAVIPELRPYVNLAESSEEFVNKMKKLPVKPDIKTIKQINNKFNWKNYVNNLVKLYQ